MSEFQVLQLKSQLESSLENYGSSHRESLKLLMQYSKLLTTYAEQQDNVRSHAYEAFKLLLPDKPPKLLTLQFQYWRLLIVIGIKLSKALEINGQLQQGLNILIQIENLTKNYNKSLEWSQNVELEYLYYHISLLWSKLSNKERTFYSANECILLIKSNLKHKATNKQIHMLSEMLQLQSSTKKTKHQQLSYFNQIHQYQQKYLGNEDKETIKTIMKINQLKSEIQFEKEIEDFTKDDDFQNKIQAQNASQIDFYGEEKSINLDQLQDIQKRKEIRPFLGNQEHFQDKHFVMPTHGIMKKSNSQNKINVRTSHQSKKSAEELKKYIDTKINLKINSRTSSQGENKFFYFLNFNNLQARTKTETTQYRTVLSKNQDRLTISQAQLRCKTNKSNITVNTSQIDQKIDNQNDYKDLMTQRPKSSLAQQRLAKQLQMSTTPIQAIALNKKSSQISQQSIQRPNDKVLKRLNTQDLRLKKQLQPPPTQALPTELSTKKSHQAQEIQFVSSLKSFTELDDNNIKQSELALYEKKKIDSIIKIQRYFKAKLQTVQPSTRRIKLNINKFSLNQLPEDSERYDKTPAVKPKIKELKLGYQRSNTSSVDSVKFTNKKDYFLQASQLQSKQKDHSFQSLASSKFINIKSASNSEILEQSSESLFDFEAFFEKNKNSWIYEEIIQGQCFFFCSDYSDQILKLLKLRAKLINYKDDQVFLQLEIAIEKQFKTYIITLNTSMNQMNWRSIHKEQGFYLFSQLTNEFVEQIFQTIPQMSFILLFMGTTCNEYIEQIIKNISIIMININCQNKLNGSKLYYNKNVMRKQNRKMIKTHYLKQRREQKTFYFKQKYIYCEKYNIKVSMRASQTELNLKNLMGNDSARQRLKAAENAILFAVKAKTKININSPLKPSPIPLMLYEDSDQSPQIIETSMMMKDPDINRQQLKSIINPKSRRTSIQESEMNRFSNIFQQNQKIHHQRNNSNQTPKKQQDSHFKKTFTIETAPIQMFKQQRQVAQALQFPAEIECSHSSQSVKSSASQKSQISQTITKEVPQIYQEKDLLPPSVTQSVNQSQAQISCFQKKQQPSLNQTVNLLDTQQLLEAKQIFDTQALEVLDLIPEQENEIESKIITIFQKDDHFTVSPNWKKAQRSSVRRKFDDEYFFNQEKTQKINYQKLHNNPFGKVEILMIGILKTEKQYFIVSVLQILKDESDLFNQAILNSKDQVKVRVTYRHIYPFGNVWEDSVDLKIKEFLKWFVPDFELSQYVKNFGLNKLQKAKMLSLLQRYGHIKDSKLKFEFYEQKNKIKEKQKIRRDLEIERMIKLESIMCRDNIDIQEYLKSQGLNQLYEEVTNERKIRIEKQQKKNERLLLFLQLTNPNELDPIVQPPQSVGLDYDGESEERTIAIPNSLQIRVLKSYNTVVYFKKQTQVIKLDQIYFIWSGAVLKLWRPFQRKIWQQVKIDNSEKLINALQCKLRNYLLNQILIKCLSLNGKKYEIRKKAEISGSLAQEELYKYFQLKQFSNQQFYNFLTILRSQLLLYDESQRFWHAYFITYKQLQHAHIYNVGDCILEILLFVDNFAQTISSNLNKYAFIRVNLFEKSNMKTKMFKLVLTIQDLQITSKKIYETNQENDRQQIFNDTQSLMQKYIMYEKQGLSKQPNLVIKNLKKNQTLKLVNKLPWISNFNYDDFQITLYPQIFQFYSQSLKASKVICIMTKFLTFPAIFEKKAHSNYESYGSKSVITKQPQQNARMAGIITVEKLSEIQSYHIYLYFPQHCRRFMTKLHFNDILLQQDSNLKLNYHQKIKLNTHRTEKYWQQLIDNFKFSINDQKKLILSIDQFRISCVLQEVIYHKIREIRRTQESILFTVNIEKKLEQSPEQIYIHYPFERIRIKESKNYNMFLKLQWLNQVDKVQSFRLPLYDLMIGYFEKCKNSGNIFDYRFQLIDIIKMCQVSIENIVMNFSLDSQKNYNNNLEQLMPQQLSRNLHKRIKLNLSLKTIEIDKSKFTLIFRGILLKKPQILVGIYLKVHRRKLYFYIQRVSDCEFFIHKIRFEELENIHPGFQLNLLNNQRALGPNIFKMLKNKLIIQCYYQLN